MVDAFSWEDVPSMLDEARSLARRLLRLEGSPEAMQTTALVLTALRRQRRANQPWSEVKWCDRGEFLRAMHGAMTHALIDYARKRQRDRLLPVSQFIPEDFHFEDIVVYVERQPDLAEAMTHALAMLEHVNAEWAELARHRLFSGYTFEETAKIMGLSDRTLRRWWRRARVLLADEIGRRLPARP